MGSCRYQGVTGTCDQSKVKPVAGIKGYVTVTPNNYTALATAVATQGPIAITVAAGKWQLYSHGIFSGGVGGSCGYELDHGKRNAVGAVRSLCRTNCSLAL